MYLATLCNSVILALHSAKNHIKRMIEWKKFATSLCENVIDDVMVYTYLGSKLKVYCC